MEMFRKSTLALVGVISFFGLFPSSGFAAKFANQFAEFELPPQWQCNLEGAEWVCQSTNDQKKRDAIIVLAAKLKGDQDSLDQYLAHLKAAKTFQSIQGRPVKSDPKYAKERNINNHVWVDALHLESEIPGFYTRYLATVKNDIGVLVTYSINKNKYQQYLQDFETMVNTLKVFRKMNAPINSLPPGQNLFDAGKVAQGNLESGTVFPNVPAPQGGADGVPKKKEEDNTLFFLLIIGVVVGFYLWRKKRMQSY